MTGKCGYPGEYSRADTLGHDKKSGILYSVQISYVLIADHRKRCSSSLETAHFYIREVDNSIDINSEILPHIEFFEDSILENA